MKTKLIILAIVISSLGLQAQNDSTKFDIRLGMNLTSFKFNGDRGEQKLNGLNTGGHLEISWRNTAFWYGFYTNSSLNNSSYIGIVQKKQVNDFYTGFSITLTTDYGSGGITPLALLYFETKWGKCFYPAAVVMPSLKNGFVGFQLKFSPSI